LYTAHVKEYCNNDFEGVADDALPLPVQLAINQMVSSANNRASGVSSKTDNAGVEVDYRAEAMSMEVRQMLRPYRKMRW